MFHARFKSHYHNSPSSECLKDIEDIPTVPVLHFIKVEGLISRLQKHHLDTTMSEPAQPLDSFPAQSVAKAHPACASDNFAYVAQIAHETDLAINNQVVRIVGVCL